jgi:hypothetical protein
MHGKFSASPTSARHMQRQYFFLCSANSTGAKSLTPLHLLFHNSPINWVELTGNGNKLKTRWRLTLTIKYCPAPWSEAYTHRLTPVSTHLSFRWTQPLNIFLHYCPSVLVHERLQWSVTKIQSLGF